MHFLVFRKKHASFFPSFLGGENEDLIYLSISMTKRYPNMLAKYQSLPEIYKKENLHSFFCAKLFYWYFSGLKKS